MMFRAVSRNISTGNQLITFFGGHMIGSRLALNLYWSRNQIYLSGFATGIAALEGYNISCERHSKEDRKKKIFYSLVRLTLNTMCFLVDTEDGPKDENAMKFKTSPLHLSWELLCSVWLMVNFTDSPQTKSKSIHRTQDHKPPKLSIKLLTGVWGLGFGVWGLGFGRS